MTEGVEQPRPCPLSRQHLYHYIAHADRMCSIPMTCLALKVGGTHVLGRVTGGTPLGLYIGLTGARLKAADCLYAGLATHYCPSDRLEDVRDGLKTLGAQ